MILKVINPIVWIGWILHILPYSFIKGFIKAKVKDAQFISSLKYAFGMFLIPTILPYTCSHFLRGGARYTIDVDLCSSLAAKWHCCNRTSQKINTRPIPS